MRFNYRGMCCSSQAAYASFCLAKVSAKKIPNSMMRAVAKWCMKQSQPTAISHCSLTKHNRQQPPSADWTDVRKDWKTTILERWQSRTLHGITEFLCDCIRKEKFHYLPSLSVCVSHLFNKCWSDGRISIKYGPRSMTEIAHLKTRFFEITNKMRETCMPFDEWSSNFVLRYSSKSMQILLVTYSYMLRNKSNEAEMR
jgi:hypothetical protein